MSQETAAKLFNQDGSLDESVLAEQYGLGPEEAAQEVQFGSYTGTVAEMLADERCPVGGMVREAYIEEGITGVADKFKALSIMDKSFSVEISPSTLQENHVKKN